MSWQPALGAWPDDEGTHFRVWAPKVRSVDVVVEASARGAGAYPLEKTPVGTFTGRLAGVTVGDRYRYRVDGQGPFPDPASRFQPEGVHGPSEVVAPRGFAWTDTGWRGLTLEQLIVYELHVGTFTSAGTFAAAIERLPYLADLGVTAIELMPVADFPGARNWGYDGVNLFAPAHCYGRPDDLRRFVDEAHRRGLAVILDVVYNHLGPDGNYLGIYSPYYVTEGHHTAWGAAQNFDGEHCEMVRAFFIENALRWVHEYHMDGLRLDATHAILDDSPRHFLAELTERVRSSAPERRILLIAEDHRNLAHILRTQRQGGWGLDAVWADGFHHQMRRLLAGDAEGYYADYTGTTADLATTMRKGWFYCGQFSEHLGEPCGTEPTGVELPQFVYCLQNHDQVGNRALGERLHHQIDAAAYRAASAVLLTGPATPLLFMGQEWSASTLFQYFTDHNAELGKLVTEGRRQEFRHFAAFSDPAAGERIPDPQAASTFRASQLRWDERERDPHAGCLRLYRRLLHLRRDELALRSRLRSDFAVEALDDGTLMMRRQASGAPDLVIVTRLRGEGTVDLRGHPLLGDRRRWELILSTEEDAFTSDPRPPHIDQAERGVMVHFARPSAIILRDTTTA